MVMHLDGEVAAEVRFLTRLAEGAVGRGMFTPAELLETKRAYVIAWRAAVVEIRARF